MTTAEEFIDEFLKHGVYDPDKAHEYYMKTRKLKGRKPAANQSSPLKKHREMDEKLNKLGTHEASRARAKAMPKLTSAQLAKSKHWVNTAEKYDKIYKSSGMMRKEDDILYSDKSDAEKNAALNELYKNPTYNKLDTARDVLFKDFLKSPEIARYFEIQYAQDEMKAQAKETAVANAIARLRVNSKSRRNAEL